MSSCLLYTSVLLQLKCLKLLTQLLMILKMHKLLNHKTYVQMCIRDRFVVLVITLGTLLGISYTQSHNEVDRVLTTLVNNQGQLTPRNAKPVFGNQKDPINKNFLAGEYNPEAIFQYRYFTVASTKNNTPKIINDANVYDVAQKKIINTSKQVFKDKVTSGSVSIGNNQYAYRVDVYKRQVSRFTRNLCDFYFAK